MAESGPTRSQGTSPSLLLRARADDPAAWRQLVELYAPLVYHWCRRAGLGPDDSADVFQEVFKAVASHLTSFRREGAKDTFRGWLRTITRNKVHDHFRRLQGTPGLLGEGGTDAQLRLGEVPDPNEEGDDSEESLVRRQLVRLLESIRGEFEERTWKAFWAVQVEGRGTDEVGAELGLTAAAVRKAKFRVLRRLREEFGEILDG